MQGVCEVEAIRQKWVAHTFLTLEIKDIAVKAAPRRPAFVLLCSCALVVSYSHVIMDARSRDIQPLCLLVVVLRSFSYCNLVPSYSRIHDIVLSCISCAIGLMISGSLATMFSCFRVLMLS